MRQQPIVQSQQSAEGLVHTSSYEQNIQQKTAPANGRVSCPSGCWEDVPDWIRDEERGEDFQFDPRRK